MYRRSTDTNDRRKRDASEWEEYTDLDELSDTGLCIKTGYFELLKVKKRLLHKLVNVLHTRNQVSNITYYDDHTLVIINSASSVADFFCNPLYKFVIYQNAFEMH